MKARQTKSDYLEFDKAMNKSLVLLKDPKKELIGLYTLVSINTGLRCSDVINLTYEQLRQETITLAEKKTGKVKTIKINKNIHDAVTRLGDARTGSAFISQKGTLVTIQHINRMIKEVFAKESKTLSISTHSCRKAFGRKVFESNGESEKSLVMLMDLYNHSSLSMTKVYLGLRQEEMNNIYDSLSI
jgi:site-specific recombinase XerD